MAKKITLNFTSKRIVFKSLKYRSNKNVYFLIDILKHEGLLGPILEGEIRKKRGREDLD